MIFGHQTTISNVLCKDFLPCVPCLFFCVYMHVVYMYVV